MISFWCSVNTLFFFGDGAIITYSYKQEINIRNLHLSILFPAKRTSQWYYNLFHTTSSVRPNLQNNALTWSSSSSNLDSGNFLLTFILAGEFLGRPSFGDRVIWKKNVPLLGCHRHPFQNSLTSNVRLSSNFFPMLIKSDNFQKIVEITMTPALNGIKSAVLYYSNFPRPFS